jgi:hypothetical protein
VFCAQLPPLDVATFCHHAPEAPFVLWPHSSWLYKQHRDTKVDGRVHTAFIQLSYHYHIYWVEHAIPMKEPRNTQGILAGKLLDDWKVKGG